MYPRPDTRQGRRHPWRGGLPLAASLLLACVGTIAVPADRSAGSTTPTSTAATFELLPDQGVVRVTVVFTITNRIPSVSTACPPGYVDCTTNYFINEGSFAVDPSGVNFRAATPGGTARVTVKAGAEGFLSDATVLFPNTYFGKTRVITTTYDIPGGAPRTGAFTRAGQAFASFCAFPAGQYAGDPESFRVVVPDRYDLAQTQGARLAASHADGKNILSAAATPRPQSGEWHGACVEAVDDEAFVSVKHTSDGGIDVETQAWPEDPDWLEAVSAIVGSALDDLEEWIGSRPGTDAIEVREVSTEALGDYAGVFNSIDSVARVSEDALDPVVAVHELAHAWFNNDFSSESWLIEGYAEATARAVLGPDVITPCPKPDADVLARVDVSPWHFLPALATDADLQKVADDYATACWLLTEVSERVGTDALREIFAAAVNGEIAYVGKGQPEVIRPGHVGWQTWIDLVDERGLAPMGDQSLDWLQEMLVRVGAADASADLARRSASRAAYHALKDAMGAWTLPIAIRMAMASWQWDRVDDELAAGVLTHEAHTSSVDLVNELSNSAAVRTMFEAAESPEDLQAALAMATREHDAAELVADAVTSAEAERNPFEWVGLLGEDLSADADGAVAALISAEYADASSTAKATTKAGGDAQTSGLIRLGGGGIVLGIGSGAVFVMRRRRRRRFVGAPPGVEADVAAGPGPGDLSGDEPFDASHPAA